MQNSLSKIVRLVLLVTAVVSAWMVSRPTSAATFCSNYQNKFCLSEGQQFLCTNFGCPRWVILNGSCSCEEGRWNCTPDVPCGED